MPVIARKIRLRRALETEAGKVRSLALREPSAADLEALQMIIAEEGGHEIGVEKRALALLTGLPVETIRALPVGDFASAVVALQEVLLTAIDDATAAVTQATATQARRRPPGFARH